jgi:hypothetical protein
MQIDDDARLEIEWIVVKMFKDIVEGNLQTNHVIQLEDHLLDIIGNKIGNYEVNVYGTSLRER